jgi:5,5'-dehydrodivanillate O-demethylase
MTITIPRSAADTADGAGGIPGELDVVHTGPGTLAGRYLRGFWQPVAVAADLAPGTAQAVRVLGEEFALYRGQGGTPFLVDQRCAHRGAQLSVGWVEDDCLRCFYHGWKYDSSGSS